MSRQKLFFLLTGPIAAILIWILCDLTPGNPMSTRMAGVAVWMAWWWMTDAIDLSVTALLPVILLPVLGIADAKMVSVQYMDPVIFLFIGGFILAFAIEKWNLHSRMALWVLAHVRSSASSVLFGIMLTAFLISMWISNTATVMMLLPAVLSIANKVHSGKENDHRFASALLLGLAYAATTGGMATLVGTPTNMIFAGYYQHHFSNGAPVTFFSWSLFALPVAAIFFVITFFVLKRMVLQDTSHLVFDRNLYKDQLTGHSKMSRVEKIVLSIFITTALLWFFKSEIKFDNFSIPGWSGIFHKPEFIHDGTIAIFMSMLLFLIPVKNHASKFIMEWTDVSKLPFGIILLFGGGFALAKGFEVSGLSEWLGGRLHVFENMHPFVILICLCFLITLMSEFASNVATIQLMLPILLPLSQTLNIPPLYLMIPATLAASMGFILPVATAPNTIVYGTGKIKISEMRRAGFVLDVGGALLIAGAAILFK